MHARIRLGYDKLVSDTWRAEVAKVKAERNAATARAEAAEAEVAWLRLALACEQGKTHREDGSEYPWTAAGWEWCGAEEDGGERCWVLTRRTLGIACSYAGCDFGSALDAETGVDVTFGPADALANMARVHKALNLPPLEGVPEVSDD